MPTYDYIRETVEERFHERGSAGPRPPRQLPCPICPELLADEAALAEHLGSAHPLSSPRLLVGGDVVIGERIFHRRSHPGTLEVANATEISVSENGGPSQPWSIAALRDTIAEASSVVLDVTLRNRRAGDGASAGDHVRLRLDIPDPAAVEAADRCFEELIACEELDEHRLDRFVDAVAESPGAARYGSALHEYGVALLIKDQARGTADSLPFAAHREKLQRSLGVLRHFPERPVARAVCGFIRFALNDFADGNPRTGVRELDGCMDALGELASMGAPRPRSRMVPRSDVVGRCPTDHATSFILDRWDLSAATQELVDNARAGATTPEDAAKCLALALRLVRDTSSARAGELARRLTNDPVFGAWARRIVEDAAPHV
ncbi:MAG: hypothetical protein WKF96_04545 [Solirubrobacteraceae bacterium]